MREALIAYLHQHPGAHFSEMLRALDVATGTLQYHLNRLQRGETVARVRDGRYTRYYLRHSLPFRQWGLAGFLRQPTPRRVLLHLLEHGATRFTALTEALRLPPSTLAFHLHRMHQAGVVDRTGRGIYALPDAEGATQLLERVGPGLADAAVDRMVRLLTGLRRAGSGPVDEVGSTGDQKEGDQDEPRRQEGDS